MPQYPVSAILEGTTIALTLLLNCPLCSAWVKHWRTIRLKQLFSRKVSQIGSTKIFRVSFLTKSSSHPKVLRSPMHGRFSTTAFWNSLSLSNSCSSIDSWISSPAKVTRTKCSTIDRSSLAGELSWDEMSPNIAGGHGPSICLSRNGAVSRPGIGYMTMAIVRTAAKEPAGCVCDSSLCRGSFRQMPAGALACNALLRHMPTTGHSFFCHCNCVK